MGEALRLVAGGSALAFAVLFGIGCLVAEVLIPYHRYAGYLKFLTLVLLFYVAAAFSVHVPWREVARATIFPSITLNRNQLLMVVAVFGTTISPYLFFWQASQEAEESQTEPPPPVCSASASDRKIRSGAFRSTRGPGCSFPTLIAFFIIVTTAATLHMQWHHPHRHRGAGG